MKISFVPMLTLWIWYFEGIMVSLPEYMENSYTFWIIELEPSCQIFALPSTAPEANILEFFDANRVRIAALGFAFCFLIRV